MYQLRTSKARTQCRRQHLRILHHATRKKPTAPQTPFESLSPGLTLLDACSTLLDAKLDVKARRLDAVARRTSMFERVSMLRRIKESRLDVVSRATLDAP